MLFLCIENGMARLEAVTDALILGNSFDQDYEMWSFIKRMMKRLAMMKQIPDKTKNGSHW